jgi:hypothetical protein
MSKVHVLERSGGDNYNCVAHFAVPVGNNSVNVPWKTAYLGSFGASAPSSVLLVGNGAGKISQSEANDITAGNLIEIPFSFGDDPTMTDPQRQALINLLADRAIADFQTSFAARYKYYGYTQ